MKNFTQHSDTSLNFFRDMLNMTFPIKITVYINSSSDSGDFTKADALFNAALVRSKHRNHNIDEIHHAIFDTYREFLLSVCNGAEVSLPEIRHEIDSHKQFLSNERRIFKERRVELRMNIKYL